MSNFNSILIGLFQTFPVSLYFALFSGFENRVGYIEIKSSTVHFYVQRNTMFDTTDVVIPFQLERLNLGGAMNLATGIFTVPVAGVYHFEFSALKDVSATRLNIDFQINGAFITRAHMNHGTTLCTDEEHVTLFSLLQLIFNKTLAEAKHYVMYSTVYVCILQN